MNLSNLASTDLTIQLTNLSIGYEATKPVIKNLSAILQPKQVIGIIGPNGAGKSTLLRTLRGFLPPLTGSIHYGGFAHNELTDSALARIIAYLQQDINVNFGYSVYEMVLTGRYPYQRWWESNTDTDREIAEACLSAVDMLNYRDTSLNQLSGGQQQRVLLAKVLAQQTPLLFLDEPTTGLDLVYQEELFHFTQLLATLGKTIIMVIHDLRLAARYCNSLLLIGEQQLLAQGSPGEVLTEANLSRAYQTPIKLNYSSRGELLDITSGFTTNSSTLELFRKICHTNG